MNQIKTSQKLHISFAFRGRVQFQTNYRKLSPCAVFQRKKKICQLKFIIEDHMLRNLFRITSRVSRRAIGTRTPLLIHSTRSNRPKLLSSSFSTETQLNALSQFQERLKKRETSNLLVQLVELDDHQQEQALHMIIDQVKYFQFSPDILFNETFTSTLQKYTTKTVYVKSMGLLASFLASEMSSKIKNKEIGEQQVESYRQYLQQLQYQGKAGLDVLDEFQSFLFSLPFLKAQIYSQFSYIGFTKEGIQKRELIKQHWKTLIQQSLKDISQNLKPIVKYLNRLKKEGSQQEWLNMKHITFQIIFDFAEEIMLTFNIAKEMVYLDDMNEFKKLLAEFIPRAEEALMYFQSVGDMKFLVNHPIHLQSELILAKYYADKMALKEKQWSEESMKALKSTFIKEAEKQYLQLRDSYLSFIKLDKQVEPIMETLIKWKFELLEESEMSSEQLNLQFQKQKAQILQKTVEESLKDRVGSTLDHFFAYYQRERSNCSTQTLKFANLDNLI